jgi:3-hydroxyisobutyrate dehydrogenase-like beta-hydroxyacid dehydrogenase
VYTRGPDERLVLILAREFQPGIRIDLHHKDMGIAIVAARDADMSLLMKVVEVRNGES